MSSDKELADAVVEIGVGNNIHDLYAFGAYHVIGCTASEFVRDWRVAGALMEKCRNGSWSELTDDKSKWSVCVDGPNIRMNESLPRAIIETYVSVLQ